MQARAGGAVLLRCKACGLRGRPPGRGARQGRKAAQREDIKA